MELAIPSILIIFNFNPSPTHSSISVHFDQSNGKFSLLCAVHIVSHAKNGEQKSVSYALTRRRAFSFYLMESGYVHPENFGCHSEFEVFAVCTSAQYNNVRVVVYVMYRAGERRVQE